jgi:hypothetical protein
MHHNLKFIRTLLGGILGGGLGGLIGLVTVQFLKTAVGVPFQQLSTGTSYTLLYWGAVLGLWAAICEILRDKLKLSNKNSIIYRSLIHIILCTLMSAVAGYALNDSLYGGAFIGLIIGFFFTIVSDIIRITKSLKSKTMFIVSIISLLLAGALFAGLTSGILWGGMANGSQSEGYVLLVTAALSLVYFAWAFGIAIGIFSFTRSIRFPYLWLVLISGFFFSVYLAIISNNSVDRHFPSNDEVTVNIPKSKLGELTKSEIVDVLISRKKVGLIEYAALYQLTRDIRWAQKIKNILLEEEAAKKYTNPAHSIKSTQMEAAIRAVCFYDIQHINGLFAEDERRKVLSWFRQIVNRIFTVEWVDYLYALAFNRKPFGPYENQEIGVAALSVFGSVLQKDFPDDAERCREFVDKHAVGWGGNFRNTDDNVNYQAWWIYSCYMIAKYRPMGPWINSENARQSFYWMLAQWPPNGYTPGYNEYFSTNLADAMALGASLFHDGRFKWLANLIARRIGLGEWWQVPYYFGFSQWDDELEIERPTLKSVYLEGPGRLPHDPGPIEPDKIVFRDGWEQDSLYALLNLRFSGWHRYKATNSFVNISYGKPFVVEDMIAKRNEWLPSGRAIYRDKKIDRIRLNGFQVGLDGYEGLLFELLQIGSKWAQDPPIFCDVEYFNLTEKSVFSKTTLEEWRGWTHNRIGLLESSKYFIVFDRAKSTKPGNCAISWHLKGNPEFGENSIILSQDKYSLGVYYPHKENWYHVDTVSSYENDPPAVEEHAPNLDMYMKARGADKAAFITAFIPKTNHDSTSIELLTVTDEKGNLQYPDVLGIEINNSRFNDKVGVAFKDGVYHYGENVVTDARQFILRKNQGVIEIDHHGATYFTLKMEMEPQSLLINGKQNFEKKDLKILKDGRYHLILDRDL